MRAHSGAFLQDWSELETKVMHAVRSSGDPAYSFLSAIKRLESDGRIDPSLLRLLDTLRRFRNQLVHKPTSLEPGQIAGMREELNFAIRAFEGELP